MPLDNTRPPLHRLLRRSRQAWRAGLLALGGLAGTSVGHATPPLTLHFQERPPYTSTGVDGSPHGLLVSPLKRALQVAGIAHRWVNTPSQRQMALIQHGQGLDCGIGWVALSGLWFVVGLGT